MQQSSFLEDPLTPVEKPEFTFVYHYTSAKHPHNHQIHRSMTGRWELQEAYRQYKRSYGDAALDHLKRMYGKTIPAGNLHLIMGTMAAHPRAFIIIGLLRSTLDPDELARQGLVPRGQRVLLDTELADLYGVTTKRFNEQVRRNRERFPADFMFQLIAEEAEALRSQIAVRESLRSSPCRCRTDDTPPACSPSPRRPR